MFYTKLFIIAVFILCSGRVQSSDNHCLIVPFDYKQHKSQVLSIGRESSGLMVILPEKPEDRKAELDRLSEKFDAVLCNNTIMSLTKIVPTSLRRVVAIDANSQIQGLVDFYILEEDNTVGYIETLFTKAGNSKVYYMLLEYALTQFKHQGITHIKTGIIEYDTHGQNVVLNEGFKEIGKNGPSLYFEYNSTIGKPLEEQKASSYRHYIIPFNYINHKDASLRIVKENLGLSVVLPKDEKEREEKIKTAMNKFDVMLHNNTAMSITKLIQGSFSRVVAIDDQNQAQGIMDFYIRSEDGKGFIETLCTAKNHTSLYYGLIKYAQKELKQKNVPSIINGNMTYDIYGRTVCMQLGFKQIEMNDFYTLFEYTFNKKN